MEFLPVLLIQDQVSLFKFWFNGNVQEGLRYRNKLFFKSELFQRYQRTEALELGYKISQKNIQTVITFSQLNYILWVDLQSSVAHDFFDLELGLRDSLVSTPSTKASLVLDFRQNQKLYYQVERS
jgi:hypothetical protein